MMKKPKLHIIILILLLATTALLSHEIRVYSGNEVPICGLNGAIDSTGRFWTAGPPCYYPMADTNTFSSFDGEIWTHYAIFSEAVGLWVNGVFVDKYNRIWVSEINYLGLYSEGVWEAFFMGGESFVTNTKTGDIWFIGGRTGR